MTGNVGGSGIGGTSAGTAGVSPASVANVYGDGGTINTNYVEAPTASIAVADAALAIGETSLVTITFSEAVTGFTNADLTVAGGTLGAVTSADGGVTWTATLTPAAGTTDTTNVITLDNTGIASTGGTPGVGTTNSNNYAIDTVRPTATVVVADTALKAGETSLVTITFSEAVSGFSTADLTVDNGVLTGLNSLDGGITWTATLTPAAAVADTSNVITLNNATVSDLAGNAGSASTGSNNYAIDTARPTASIVVADNALSAGETSLVTITFSEAVSGFSNSDLTVANGTLSAVSSADGGVTWTATLTPTASTVDASNIISLNNTGVSDAAGNAGTGTTDSNNYAVDTNAPTATVVVADTALAVGETSLVTITFSESVSGFDNADLAVANGTLGAVSSADGGITWTATFTPTAGVTDASNVMTLANSGVQNLAGNPGVGSTSSNNYAIDTARPTAAIVVADTALMAGESSLVTFTFSEAVSGFTTADLVVGNGAVTGLGSLDGGITWTGTLTPDAAVSDATNLVSLANTGVSDAAGNTGSGTTDSANFSVSTVRPTVAVALADSALAAGETTDVTFTFSEAVSGFDNADIAVANGTLGTVATADGGVTWTATLTPSAGVADASNAISVTNTGYTNAAGNTGSGTTSSANYTVSTVRPTVAVALSDNALKAGETATVTFTFSEAVSGFDNSDITVANGALGPVSSSDGGVTWSAVFTPAADLTDASNVISVSAAGVMNAAGNAGTGQSDSANYAIDTDRPDATVALSDSALAAGETALLTITFDQAVSGFSGASITVANGSLSGLASLDGGITWTATLTPSAATADASNVVSVNMAGLSDASGNSGSGLASSANYTVDTVRPGATVVVADNALLAGETSPVTITFSQAVTGLGLADFSVANGTLSNLASADGGVTWTATLAPTDGVDDTSNVITLDNTAYASAAGSTGTGTTSSNNYALATARPSASIVVSDAVLGIGATTTVTITFSEAVSGFTNDDLSVGSGSLSPVSSTDGGVTWVATLTPSAAVSSSGNVITLNNTGVQDASGNTGAATTSSNAYTVNTRVDRPPPVPDDTVDGVPVFSDVVTDPETGIVGTIVTVPFVPVGRSDDPSTPNRGLADIPLGIETPAGSPQVDLVVSLPAGAGLRAEGPNSLLSNAQALVDLINRIEDKTAAGSAVQQELAGQGADFLGTLGSAVVLETKTLVPTVSPGATLGQPIVITGSSATPAPGTQNATAIALVIDASGLPANAVLQLDNVDFAAIIGAATLRGGSGENFVIGDGAAQNIFLGADDDQLYGGGGNDIVGSAGGNDLLDGGSGNDTVVGGIGNDSVAGGSGHDLLQGGRSAQGGWQFFVDATGHINARHETALFAPGSSELVTVAELNHDASGLGFLDAPAQRLADLGLLYRSVFGRAPDLGGLEFWSGSDATMAEIASAFGRSAEWAAAGYDQLSDAGFVSQLYQHVLGRATDAGGAAFWVDKLAGSGAAAPLSRSEVVLAIALSDEHKAASGTVDGIAIGVATNTSETDWFAGSGDDLLEGGLGNDVLVGGDGVDTVVYGGELTGYKFLLTEGGQVQVLDRSNGDLDTLSGIENGVFAGAAADLGFTQATSAGLQQLGLLYQTLFDRAADLGGITWWAGQYSDANAAVLGFMATPEYAARYGSVSDTQLVEALYRNTGLQESDAGGIAAWESYLGSHTRAELIASWVSNDSVIDAQFGSQGLWLI
ncbi:Ig-like domain-containing protein [Massilia sp. MAHUQ-52]|uniref:Ig-like domain-containing protein n=2 Tax=Telluria group TaxID=2895353 RepID=A0ABS8INZ8_9BURK|nr:Ig-like domain-containing protein [Massilia agrisoli]